MHPITCRAPVLLSLSLLFPATAMAVEPVSDPVSIPHFALISLVEYEEPFLPQAIEPVSVTEAAPGSRQDQQAAGIGETLAMDKLEEYRGGSDMISQNTSRGRVQDATAINVSTGTNLITDGAFAHVSGLPIVIQNSGANVLIQNSTIVNVNFQ